MGVLLSSPLLLVLLQAGGPNRVMLGGAAACFMLLMWTIRSSFSQPVSRSTLARLQNYVDREENLSPLERILERQEHLQQQQQVHHRRDRGADLLPTLTRFMTHSRIEFLNNLSADLNRVGSNWRASEIIYVAVLLAMIGFFLVGIVMRRMTTGLLIAAGLWYAPIFFVKLQARRWAAKFETQLADTLLLMSNATAAGYGFQQAMEMVAREGQPPMADEFGKMSQEVQLGVPIAEALSHMSDRVRNPDFTLAVTAIQISMEVGGALSEILRSISETIRERVRIRGEIRILTTQGRVTGLGLSALPIFMIFLLNWVGSDPQTGERYTAPLLDGKTYPLGPKMVGYGVFSQVMGYLIINKIVNIEI